MATKQEIRQSMLARRCCVTQAERSEYSHEVCERLCSVIEQAGKAKPRTIAVYLATDEEIDIDDFILSASSQGNRIAAPRWNPATKTYELAELSTRPSSHRSARELQTIPGHWGIREPPPAAEAIAPCEIDLWIVPGLAFTKDGRRIGYGGGYYDRFLANAAPDAHTIAVAYPFQIFDSLPTDSNDVIIEQTVALRAF